MRHEISKERKMKEAIQKKFRLVEEQKADVEVQRGILKARITGLEKGMQASLVHPNTQTDFETDGNFVMIAVGLTLKCPLCKLPMTWTETWNIISKPIWNQSWLMTMWPNEQTMDEKQISASPTCPSTEFEGAKKQVEADKKVISDLTRERDLLTKVILASHSSRLQLIMPLFFLHVSVIPIKRRWPKLQSQWRYSSVLWWSLRTTKGYSNKRLLAIVRRDRSCANSSRIWKRTVTATSTTTTTFCKRSVMYNNGWL